VQRFRNLNAIEISLDAPPGGRELKYFSTARAYSPQYQRGTGFTFRYRVKNTRFVSASRQAVALGIYKGRHAMLIV
jgi:hypothetical protein